jgi:hypothetical protein
LTAGESPTMSQPLAAQDEPYWVVTGVHAPDPLVDDDGPVRLSTRHVYVARMLPEGLECASD